MSSPGAQLDAESSNESDAAARDARAQQRTWVIGGVLLVLSALIGLIGRWSLAWMHYGQDWLWGIGALVLIIGLGRAGSITGRRSFATIVTILQVIVASPATAWYLSTRLPDLPPSTHAAEDAWTALFIPYYLLVFVLTVTAAILIARARAVPTPWNWAPMWALGAAMAFGVAFSMGAYGLGGIIVVYLPVISTAFLGILGIALGLRAGRAVPAA